MLCCSAAWLGSRLVILDGYYCLNIELNNQLTLGLELFVSQEWHLLLLLALISLPCSSPALLQGQLIEHILY